MTEVNYNGKEELLMADYEGISDSDLTSKYANTDFDITDAPSTYITNTQMTYALTCRRLFPAGDTYICNDEGAYKKGHIYIIKVDGATKSWEDITPSGGGGSSKTIIDYATLESDTSLQKTVFENPDNYAIKTTVNLSGSDANVLCFPATSPENGTSGYTLKYFASYPVGVYGNDTASVAIALMKYDGSEDITLLNVPLTYQQKLTAGEGITIDGSTIKSTGVPERVKQGDDLNYNYTDFIRNATEINLKSKSHTENADKEQNDVSNSLHLSYSDASISSAMLDTTSGNNVKFSSTIRLIGVEPRIEQQAYDAITGKEKSYIAIKGIAGKNFHYVKSQNELIDDTNEIAVKKDIIGNVKTLTYDNTTLADHIYEILGYVNTENGGNLININLKVASAVNGEMKTVTNTLTTNALTNSTSTVAIINANEMITLNVGTVINDSKGGKKITFTCANDTSICSFANVDLSNIGGTPTATISGQEIDFGTGTIITNYFKGIDILNTTLEHLVINYYTI